MTIVSPSGESVACELEWAEGPGSAVELVDITRLVDAVEFSGRLVKAGEVVDEKGAYSNRVLEDDVDRSAYWIKVLVVFLEYVECVEVLAVDGRIRGRVNMVNEKEFMLANMVKDAIGRECFARCQNLICSIHRLDNTICSNIVFLAGYIYDQLQDIVLSETIVGRSDQTSVLHECIVWY